MSPYRCRSEGAVGNQFRHKPSARQAGEMQCLGGMPWVTGRLQGPGIEDLFSGVVSDPEPNCLPSLHRLLPTVGGSSRQSAGRRKPGVGDGDARPVDRGHECIDISGRLGAIVDMIGVLVHVEREDRWPPASVCVWSEAHWLTSLRSRGDQVSSTQPEPPRSAFPIALNSAARPRRCRNRAPARRAVRPRVRRPRRARRKRSRAGSSNSSRSAPRA